MNECRYIYVMIQIYNEDRACVLDVAKFDQYLWITHWSKTSNSRNLVNFGRRVQNKAPLER